MKPFFLYPFFRKVSPAAVFFVVLGLVFPFASFAKEDLAALSFDELAERSTLDTLYYKFDKWVPEFKKRIHRLESQTQTMRTRVELMKHYFYLAALKGEMTHALSFTRKYQVGSIKEEFYKYATQAKSKANDLLNNFELSKKDRADAFFYLGVSEGYVALLEYGEGNIFSALIDGLSADNHLEDSLKLDPKHADANVGLGIYRYGNTRLGGLSNWIMQFGEDNRLVGLSLIEQALKSKIVSRPLAIKTLIWFYLSEQINPDNKDLPPEATLSPKNCRLRALALLEEYESQYFRNVEDENFKGNKGLSMMRAIQYVLDEDYASAQHHFENALDVSHFLIEKKQFRINPRYVETVKAGIRFCKVMQARQSTNMKSGSPQLCKKVNDQVEFIENGGSMVEYQSSKIRGEIQDIFYLRLKSLFEDLNC